MHLALVWVLGLWLVGFALGACGTEPAGSNLGASTTILTGGDNVNPSARAGLGPGVNVVDPWTVEMIREEARAALGDRYVDIWWADEQIALLLGVYAPTEADMVFLREFTSKHWVVAVECPVSLAELDGAAKVVFNMGEADMLAVSINVVIGRIELEVTGDQIDRIVAQINTAHN